ncbi:hypothetical protein M404DRAFT_70597, partial [Pisolithus tinctorius Marx 270]
MGMEPFLSKAEAATDHAVDLAKVLEDTKKALDKAAECMKVSADTSCSDAPSYSVVSLKPNAVELKLPKTLRIHPVVNVSRVKPYKGPLEGQTVTRPGPVVGHEGNEEFEVDH